MGPALLAIVCLGLAGALAAPIGQELEKERSKFDPGNSFDRLFGSAKEVVGDELFLKADSYFHGGVKMKFKEKPENYLKQGFIEDEDEGHGHDDHDCEAHDHGTAGAPKASAPKKDWIQKINDQIVAHQHYHLEGEKTREMLPFFALATQWNPYNVEAILTTSYWLEKYHRQYEENEALLKKAIITNPAEWRLELALANFYFRVKQDMAQSRGHYLAALQKSEGRSPEPYLQMDMHYYLAESLVRLGERDQALEHYRQALDYFSQENPRALRQTILDKIKELSYNTVAEGAGS